jgi:Fe2+ transport system protein FeoA
VTASNEAATAERTLDRCPVGTTSVLRRVEATRVRRRRLAELGFVPGARIEVIGRGGVGGLIVAVNADSRVAVDAAGARELRVDGSA